MIVKKILQARVDIENINDIFCADYNSMLIRILEQKYLNRCFRSIYITKVTKIINRSNIKCKNKELNGTVYADILFEVEGLIYEKNDIIHNCKIIRIDNNGMMHAKSDNTSLQIKNNTGINIFKEEQIIPVLVSVVRYQLYSKNISVLATPLQPIVKKIILYKIESNELKDELKDELKGELKEIELMEKEINTIKKKNLKVYDFFVKLIYPFKTKKNEINKYIKKANIIKDIEKIKNVILYRTNSWLDDNNFYYFDEKNINKIPVEGTLVNISEKESKLNIIQDYKKNLYNLMNFIKIYGSFSEIQKNQNIWKLYNMLRK